MVDYNNFAKTFSNSRKNLKWEEISYFLNFISGKNNLTILDIGCGNGRLLGELLNNNIVFSNYLGIDLSSFLLNEAKKNFLDYDFFELDMNQIDKIDKKFDVIFFIASFHHLDNFESRLDVLKKAYNLLNTGGKIFFTNWALDSKLNFEKYKDSIIKGSKNEFGSIDYNIKIGEFTRFYHCFSLEELDKLFTLSGYKIIENKLYINEKNIISIIEKK